MKREVDFKALKHVSYRKDVSKTIYLFELLCWNILIK